MVSENSKYNFHMNMTSDQGHETTLTSNTHISLLNQLVSDQRLQSVLKNFIFLLFRTEKPKLENNDLTIN